MGVLLWLTWGTWWAVPAFMVHGTLINFLYAGQHELSHGTVFRTRWPNEWVGRVFGFVLFFPRTFDQVQHMAHHRYTQDWARDGELAKGLFIKPTIFADVRNDMSIAQEEIFGPVLATLSFSDIDEVASLANANPYGLAAAIWTNDVKKAHALSKRLRAGTVWINTYGLMDAALPFGGYKQSGFGRELGAHAIDSYTEVKTVWMNL